MKKLNVLCLAAVVFLVGSFAWPLVARQGDVEFDWVTLRNDLFWGDDVDGVEIVPPGDTGRRWLRDDGVWSGVGLADAASDLLERTTSTLSATHDALMSATVESGATGDRVLISVNAQMGLEGGAGLLVASIGSDDLWTLSTAIPPVSTATPVSFPADLTAPSGMAIVGSSLVISHTDLGGDDDQLWVFPNPTDLGTFTRQDFPTGLASAFGGMAAIGTTLYVTDDTVGNEALWTFANIANLSTGTSQDLPAGIVPFGMTSDGLTTLYVSDNSSTEKLWTFTDPTDLSTGTSQDFPSGVGNPTAMAIVAGGALHLIDRSGEEMWRFSSPASVGSGTRGNLPSGLESVQGMVYVGDGPCDVRIARGSTAVETFTLRGLTLLDATFVDEPPAGTHTYALQMRSSNITRCTAYGSDGTIPLPSLLVQVFYGE